MAVFAAGMVVIGDETGAARPRIETDAGTSIRPTREELARAARLYAGEFGGGEGVR
jgi:hypothetical protein